MPHPVMASDEIRERTQAVWDQLCQSAAHLDAIAVHPTLRARLAVLISKLYRQMYANTGIATDSAREPRKPVGTPDRQPCRHLFTANPLPALEDPRRSWART